MSPCCVAGSSPTLDADSLELHTKLEALKVIASTAALPPKRSMDDDETTEGSDRGDLVTATSSMKTLSSDFQETNGMAVGGLVFC